MKSILEEWTLRSLHLATPGRDGQTSASRIVFPNPHYGEVCTASLAIKTGSSAEAVARGLESLRPSQ
jgi:hypothetical protein